MRKNKKDDSIDKLLDEQRKNLRFVDSEPIQNSSAKKFVTVDEVAPSGGFVPENLRPRAGVIKRPKLDNYVDIRKFKLEKNKKLLEEQNLAGENDSNGDLKISNDSFDSHKDDDDLFGVDYVLNKNSKPLNGLPEKEKSPFSDRRDEIVPEPEEVRKSRVEKSRKKIFKKKMDADLVPQKTYSTYFDDLE